MSNLPPLSPFTLRPKSATDPAAARTMLVARRPSAEGMRSAKPRTRIAAPPRARLKRALMVLDSTSTVGA